MEAVGITLILNEIILTRQRQQGGQSQESGEEDKRRR
jgi:hypothetical protein